jgi:hypothetical protein
MKKKKYRHFQIQNLLGMSQLIHVLVTISLMDYQLSRN